MNNLIELKDVDEGGDECSGEGSEEGDFKFLFQSEYRRLVWVPTILTSSQNS